jgi:hypothetical protein
MTPVRALMLLVAATAAFESVSGCSLIIESRDRQCERDTDCSSFDNAKCDVAEGVCVSRVTSGTGGGGSGGGCEGPDGCYSCAPSKPVEYLNGCTDATCIPYDNTPLQDLLEPDGSVPPVP